MTSHILWQNAEKTVSLIDIPRSIVEAQGFNKPEDHDLLSSPPREAPYPSSEPKSAAARAKLVDNTVDQELHAEYREVLQSALHEVRQHRSEDWCLPRPFVEEAGPRKKKRKLNDAEDAACTQTPNPGSTVDTTGTKQNLPDWVLSSLSRRARQQIQVRMNIGNLAAARGKPLETPGVSSSFNSNDSAEPVVCAVSEKMDKITPPFNFRVPPKSSFMLGDCTASYDFRKAVREHAQQQATRSTFDFILLDPPWPNRSIKRTHKTAGATYDTIPSLENLGDLVMDMQLDSMMAANALVGVWITNKQAARDLILGLGGFFESWGIDLVEEWIWLKTTTSGEPTSVLDAMWKKPYEVLLLGRKRRTHVEDSQQPNLSVKRKVIIAVPDLHSRKPWLKSLIEPMMPHPEKYSALEIFARHLVAGWCSWGDECIKFNWEGYWRERDQSSL